MKENIFITGANGWIGEKFLEKLLLNRFNVVALIRKKNTRHKELEKKNSNLRFIESELEKIEQWENSLNNIDILIHLAAKVHTYSKKESEALEFHNVNFTATKNIFEAAENFGVKRGIFISSIAVTDLTKEQEQKIEYAYASSKLNAENFLVEFNKVSNMEVQIIRPVTLYGGLDKGNFKKLYNLARFKFFPIIGDGKNLKSVIYYEDFADALLNIMREPFNANNEMLTIGAETISMNEIAQQFKKSNKNLIVIKIPLSPINFMLKIISLVSKKNSLKLKRQIYTLNQSNTYEYQQNMKYLPKEITFFKSVDFKNEYMRNENKK